LRCFVDSFAEAGGSQQAGTVAGGNLAAFAAAEALLRRFDAILGTAVVLC
jgi:hypothetical protein